MLRPSIQMALCICLSPVLAAQETTEPQRAPADAQTAVPSPTMVRLAVDTQITLRLDQDVSSADAKVGDRVRFALAEDLTAEGRMVAPAGAFCYAVVRKARQQDSKSDGYLEFSDAELDLGHGQVIRFTDTRLHDRRTARAITIVAPVAGLPLLAIGNAVSLPINLALVAHDALHSHTAPGTNQRSTAAKAPQRQDDVHPRGSLSHYYVRNTVRVGLKPPASSQTKVE